MPDTTAREVRAQAMNKTVRAATFAVLKRLILHRALMARTQTTPGFLPKKSAMSANEVTTAPKPRPG